MSQFFTSGGQSIGASASVLAMINNIGGRQLTGEVLSNDFLHLPSEMREGNVRRKNENWRSMKEV